MSARPDHSPTPASAPRQPTLSPHANITPSTTSAPTLEAPAAQKTTLISPPPTAIAPPATSVTETSTTAAPASGAGDTATTSLGGTIWTRCSGPNSIVFVAAIPKPGYQRTTDVQLPTRIEEQFQNGNHVSTIQAECAGGAVHAEVEEETDG
jgi:hypothetical protein